MTPNTSDSPEAMRNRNIAVVSPPRNWPKSEDMLTGGTPVRAIAVQWRARRARRRRLVADRGRRPVAPASARAAASPSLRQRSLVDILGIFHHREGIGGIL